jgi:hypothetical protein
MMHNAWLKSHLRVKGAETNRAKKTNLQISMRRRHVQSPPMFPQQLGVAAPGAPQGLLIGTSRIKSFSKTIPPNTALPPLQPPIYEVQQGSRLQIDSTTGEILSCDGQAPDAVSPWKTPRAAAQLFFLPRLSVTPDYLNYQLWTIPAHITGWMSTSLVTSSLLKAVGLSAGPGGIIGMSAAINWLTRDGLGALGRFFVGGKLNTVFDEDPRRWRMTAEFITTLGLALEVGTQLSPSYFVLLAGAGNLTKALGKGMGRPCFRVIQTYFSSITNNVGDVAAREEVWEVSAQLIGLLASVAVLKTIQTIDAPPESIIPTWAVIQAVHVTLRYRSLLELRFPFPNQKRAAVLITTYLDNNNKGRVPSIEEVNSTENLLLPPSAYSPYALFGSTITTLLAAMHTDNNNNITLGELMDIYKDEQYIMAVSHNNSSTASTTNPPVVVLWDTASGEDMMRAMFQVAVFNKNSNIGDKEGYKEELKRSLDEMRQQYPGFEKVAAEQGWVFEKAIFPDLGSRIHRKL